MSLRGLVITVVLAILLSATTGQAQTADVGYRDFSYGSTVNGAPTQQKPQSKLWWNDGFWWGSLFNSAASRYEIYRFDIATQVWVGTGTALDTRPGTLADALWDGQHLYIASHTFTTTAEASTTTSAWGRVYRYSYNSTTHTYTLDSGFPVNVTRGRSETLVIAKDSTGQLWVTYVEGGRVMVNCSNGDDKVWGEPFILPVSATATTVTTDDISSVIAFQGNKVGVMWSNQNDTRLYFAIHNDSDSDQTWQAEEVALPTPANPGDTVDDHINMKTDSGGKLYVATKTSLTTSTAPLDILLVRDTAGNWTRYVFGTKSNAHTRPIVLLDESHGHVYMFATSPETGGSIYYKRADINNISFPTGVGTPFIRSSLDTAINDPTSTKQNVNSTTGLLVEASNTGTRFYLHNYLSLAPVTNPPAITVNDVTLDEGNSGTRNAVFTVSLSSVISAPVTVDYATANGTATASSDYTSTSGTLTIPAGSAFATISVPVIGNLTAEADETFFLNLSNPTNATISDAQGVGTIRNDDGAPSMTINNVSSTENNTTNKLFNFTVTLSAPSSSPVTVDYATADGTATAPGDYTSTSGTLTIPAGTTTATIAVTVIAERVIEPDETFFVNLSNAAGATIADAQGQGTIRNDDAPPTITINNVSLTEGNTTVKTANFTVTLSYAHNVPVTVDYATADGTATAPSDYNSASGTLTIPAGTRSVTVGVTFVPDRTVEPNETYFVNLSNPTNATISDGQGLGTITNDDAPPAITISNRTATEGAAGTTKPFNFTVTLSFAVNLPVTVDYATADGTAVAPGDYLSTSGTLTIPAGTRSVTVAVTVVGDRDIEPNETFFVNLSNATNATISDSQGLGTITNDDTPTLSVNNRTLTEGNSGTKSFTFTVTLSFAIDRPVTVDYVTADGTATVAGGDYLSASGTVTIPAGVRTATFTVQVVGDTVVEPNETFSVKLSNATNATISDSQGLGTISNDDV